MTFIIWTAVWFTLCNINNWIGLIREGHYSFYNWYDKRFTFGFSLVWFAAQLFAWIYLYEHYIKSSWN